MPKYTAHDFANYRNLARRAESSGDDVGELRLLDKCLEIYEWRHGIDCSRDTFVDLVNRRNALSTKRLGARNG
jgi:hypothetical protein